ncbi:MAG TPA: protein kinase [Gemmatimonas sp.]|nr:protein kinase [Gemmatimonas sp.]
MSFNDLATAIADRYQIERELGAGGMATVYLARDLKHDRRVALKVLRPELAAVIGAERFLAEIKTTANLQHPHILPLFDSGTADHQLFYVMPFIDGETLRGRLERETQLPIADAVRLASEVASALEYAHKQGVVHRDIKPENILLQDGSALVADFGIALAVQHAGGERMTQTGMSLGTPHYMSPEQAMGQRTIDARTDIYALGAITYEMLIGEPPFTGPSAQAIVAKVMTETPKELTSQRRSVPPHVAAAVENALEKLPADRVASAREFAEALQGKSETTASTRTRPTSAARRASAPVRIMSTVGAVVALLAVGGAGWMAGRRQETGENVVRLAVSVPAYAPFANIYAGPPLAISPDGMTIAYTARTGNGPQLALRRLDDLAPRVLTGTVAGIYPTFVSGGRALVFSDGAQFYRVALDGTAAVPASQTQAGAGNGTSSLGDDGFLIGAFNSTGGAYSGLNVVRAFGDSIRALTRPDKAAGDQTHNFPVVIDNSTVLFTSFGLKGRRIGIASLTNGQFTVLDLPGVSPLGMVDDYLIYVQGSGLTDGLIRAVKVDLGKRKVTGEPVTIEEGVAVHGNGSVEAALSPSGTLVYSSGSTTSRMMQVDVRGASQPLFAEARRLASPRYSPDGKRVAVNRTDDASDVWIYDVGSKVPTRLTSEGATSDRPEWSADGTRVAYRFGAAGYRWQGADGSEKAQTLLVEGLRTTGGVAEIAMIPDGKRLIARIPHFGTAMDLMLATIGDSASTTPFLQTRFNEYMPTVSRDGKWVAYISTEAGPLDVYVRSLDGASSRFPVSTGGGMEPRWAPDGKHIYYRANRMMMSATIETNPEFRVTSRDTLFADIYATDPFHTNYDVSPDGTHFLMLQPLDNSQQAVVVLNFAKEVRAKMAAAK